MIERRFASLIGFYDNRHHYVGECIRIETTSRTGLGIDLETRIRFDMNTAGVVTFTIYKDTYHVPLNSRGKSACHEFMKLVCKAQEEVFADFLSKYKEVK